VKQLATELGYVLEIDGPSDEELEQLKRDDEAGQRQGRFPPPSQKSPREKREDGLSRARPIGIDVNRGRV
jgi:hypothetical protein